MQPVDAHGMPVFLFQMSHRRILWTLYAINFLTAAGGFIALFNFGLIFISASAAAVVAALALSTLPNARVHPAVEAPVRALRIARGLVPLILLGAGTSYMIGTYDTIWPLYMTFRG